MCAPMLVVCANDGGMWHELVIFLWSTNLGDNPYIAIILCIFLQDATPFQHAHVHL